MRRRPQTDLPRPRLRVRDVAALAVFGLRTRSQRSALSALGIAIGVATLVAVLGISQSSSAQLIDQLNRLGTNLLAATPTSLFGGQQPTLPAVSPAMVQRIGPVQAASAIGDASTNIYRNSHIPAPNTDALTVYAALPNLITTLQGQIAQRTLPQRHHRPLPDRRPRRDHRPSPRHRPNRRAGSALARSPLVHRDRNPRADRAGAGPRPRRADRLPGYRGDPPPSAATRRDLHPRQSGPARRRAIRPAGHDRPRPTPRRRDRPALRRPRRPRRRQNDIPGPVPRARRPCARRRRDRNRQRDGARRTGTPHRDRPAARARSDPAPGRRTVPRRSDR